MKKWLILCLLPLLVGISGCQTTHDTTQDCSTPYCTVHHHGIDYTIRQELVGTKILTLILNTESMNSKDRQFWLMVYPALSDEQKQRLFNILDNERKQLQELEEFYRMKKAILELD